MDTVPVIFVESVCRHLLDHRSLHASRDLPSMWGEICTAITNKIHTLLVHLDGSSEKIYAAAQPMLLYDDYSYAVSLDSVDPKFITNFRIEAFDGFRSWKEITVDDLKKLVHFIRPVRNERHPLQYGSESLNTLRLDNRSRWISGQLLSMRLPVDMVDLRRVEGADLFEPAGPLYYVNYEGPAVKESTLDAFVEKFVPIDNGYFNVRLMLSEEHMKKLFEKCAVGNKTVQIWLIPEDSTKILDLTDPIDYDKYYSDREILRPWEIVRFGNKEKEKLTLQVYRSYGESIGWMWFKPSS
uniref:F-box domain-containing protein n=1 Tax=Steinernema glaseri TaxID=37863 RepID=A0A1I7Z736_9BILA